MELSQRTSLVVKYVYDYRLISQSETRITRVTAYGYGVVRPLIYIYFYECHVMVRCSSACYPPKSSLHSVRFGQLFCYAVHINALSI